MYVPPIDDTTRTWWTATTHGVFLLQQCDSCGAVQHPPRNVCLACTSVGLRTIEALGDGSIDSFTVVHRAPQDDFSPPYVVARVRLDEGPVILTNIVDCDPDSVRCDDRVSLRWRALEDGRQLPTFAPKGDGSSV